MKSSNRPAAASRPAAATLFVLLALAGCDDAQQKPNESNTYNVHLFYGKDVAEHKYLGQVRGISKCKTTVHAEAARMHLKGHTYRYDCCWVNAGKACYQKHK